ncbi:MAG: TIGR03960 family B12-binding radical SAM protein [Desulfovibrionaceae bacterium]|nr:TIGR03960 family B12-binding radical SAM protein [Desulfovibrionaceae bacterium]
MKELLPLLPHPSHYTGIEEGSVHKDPSQTDLHCVLAFPDLYEVGMSYLGHKILYNILNSHREICAERVFAPDLEAANILKAHHVPLATLESDTPLGDTHLIGFSITHELCFTNILYMLDLAGIPLRTAMRGNSLTHWPIIAAGGGCAISSEPMAPFFDLMMLGDGEELFPELCALLRQGRLEGWNRREFLLKAANIPGIYVPSLYEHDALGRISVPKGIPMPGRRIVSDLNRADYPERQIVPFGAVHNRLSLEIARGCTRGCRFCQAGILYRPARERKPQQAEEILSRCLKNTGFDEISFLSLSTGDYSALKTLFLKTSDRCAAEQIAISLPSLRIGSIDDSIMERMAGIRRTGATLAPEAGSQRMRDIINKGITEEEILLHVQKLFEHGWQQVKLYFMIGLPGEKQSDLEGIVDLCRKVRDAAGGGKRRLQVTAAISPFVPKPFTPFQWERQLSLPEITQRIRLLRHLFDSEKNIKMRWHEPACSHLEGILSRADRRLADVVEKAYRKGALFTSWIDHFALEPWLEALAECGLSADLFTGSRKLDAPLPWDHLNPGVSRSFLLRERKKAFQELVSPDCRYHGCHGCGACDIGSQPSLLPKKDPGELFSNRLVFPQRDQESHRPKVDENGRIIPAAQGPAKKADAPSIRQDLVMKAVRYRIWHRKEGSAAFLSPLELQSVLERALRRAEIPLSFSQGFHPLPLLSFGRALSVGIESCSEWFSACLRTPLRAEEVIDRLSQCLPAELQPIYAESIPLKDKSVGACRETYTIRYSGIEQERFRQLWKSFAEKDSHFLTRETKKGPRTSDIRGIFQEISWDEDGTLRLTMNWSEQYISPIVLISAVVPGISPECLHIVKQSQELPQQEK